MIYTRYGDYMHYHVRHTCCRALSCVQGSDDMESGERELEAVPIGTRLGSPK